MPCNNLCVTACNDLGQERWKPLGSWKRRSGRSTKATQCAAERAACAGGETHRKTRGGAAAATGEARNEARAAQAAAAAVPCASAAAALHAGGEAAAAETIAPVASRRPYRRALVGRRIRVFWDGDAKWYSGCVRSYSESTNRHMVLYDDGYRRVYRLSDERWSLLEGEGEGEDEGMGEEAPGGATRRCGFFGCRLSE